MPVPRPRPRLAFEILFAWSLAAVSLQAEPAAVVSGELESADYIHRTGQFRRTDSGQLVDFALPPGGFILHLNAEADLRDVPLGTFFHFYFYFYFFVDQEREGTTRVDLSSMCDQFTHDAHRDVSYRLEEITPHVTAATRIWRAGRQVAREDLEAVDGQLRFNLTGKTATDPGRCTDIWADLESQRLATEEQRKKFVEFTKFRGLPAEVEKTQDNRLTVTLFSGDPANFRANFLENFVVGRDLRVVVANRELRTWNPPVDNERAVIDEVQDVPSGVAGSSGVRLVAKVNNMLEGFRKGRIVRLFGAGWPLKDQFYGESLMGYGYERLKTKELLDNPAREFPEQFPFRTDYGNAHLPWFQLKPGLEPPPFAEHRVLGELLSADAEARTGKFRDQASGETVEFVLTPTATVKHLGAEASLADLPSGSRCRFHLFQDKDGAFTRANFVGDEFSHLSDNAISWRVDALLLDEGKIHVAWQIPEVKNYNGDMERPPDIGHSVLHVTDATEVWKGDAQVRLADLAVGDDLLANLSGERPASPSQATAIWIGEDTHQRLRKRK